MQATLFAARKRCFVRYRIVNLLYMFVTTSNSVSERTSHSFVLRCVYGLFASIVCSLLSGNFTERNFVLIYGVCTNTVRRKGDINKQQILERLAYRIILPYIYLKTQSVPRSKHSQL
jgi:hypothetical protein